MCRLALQLYREISKDFSTDKSAQTQKLDTTVFLVDLTDADDSYDCEEHGAYVSDGSCVVFAETFVEEGSV